MDESFIDWHVVTNLTHTFSGEELRWMAQWAGIREAPILPKREAAIRLAILGIDVSNVRYALAMRGAGR